MDWTIMRSRQRWSYRSGRSEPRSRVRDGGSWKHTKSYSAAVSVREDYMQHLDEGTIHAWLDGALDAEESARVEEHVAQCAACSAAVEEARGFVAGASRILTALDQTPGGVAPRSPTFDVKQRRSASLWGALHLTPARAAAAALIFVAAGTALVARYANMAQPAATLGDAVRGGRTAAASAEAKPAAPRAQAGGAATGAVGRRKAAPLSARIATS